MTAVSYRGKALRICRENIRPRRRHQLDFLRLGGAALFHADHDLRVRALFCDFRRADPASGQALWGFATAAAGLAIALLSPVLGAIADASGRRKPWIAGFGALLVIGASLMWIGKPGDPASSRRCCSPTPSPPSASNSPPSSTMR